MAEADGSSMTDEELRAHIQSLRAAINTFNPGVDDVKSIVDKDTLKKMLRREQELRTSDATQKMYMAAEQSGDTDWMEVTAELQKQVTNFLGLPDF